MHFRILWDMFYQIGIKVETQFQQQLITWIFELFGLTILHMILKAYILQILWKIVSLFGKDLEIHSKFYLLQQYYITHRHFWREQSQIKISFLATNNNKQAFAVIKIVAIWWFSCFCHHKSQPSVSNFLMNN